MSNKRKLKGKSRPNKDYSKLRAHQKRMAGQRAADARLEYLKTMGGTDG